MRSSRMRLMVWALALGLGLSGAGVALAQDDGEEPAEKTKESREKGSKEEEKPDVAELLAKADDNARRGRYKQAIPVYKQVLQQSPDAYPTVYFNLAEISYALKDVNEAAMLYQRYLDLTPDAPDKERVEKKIRECHKALTYKGKITLKVEGPPDPVVVLGGIPVATTPQVTLTLAAGKYELKVDAPDHIPVRSVLEVRDGDDKDLVVKLKAQTYFGTFTPTVNIEGAAVFVDGQQVGTTPMEPHKLPAGKHFVEFKKEGYHRWIRNIVVGRDEDYLLEVNMQKLGKGP